MNKSKIAILLVSVAMLINACKPDSEKKEEINSLDSASVSVNINGFNIDSLQSKIDVAEKKLFANKLEKPDASVGLEAVKAYTEFINQFPNDKRVPEYLFKAGEISSALNYTDAAIGYFENLYTKFPKHNKAIFAMFLHAFILENQSLDLEKAKQKYEQVIATFPNSQQASDAKASIEHLGKTPEDLVKEFEKKNKK